MRRWVLLAAAALVLPLATVGTATAEDSEDLTKPFVTTKVPPNHPSVEECSVAGNPAADLRLDCDDPYPNNEPNVVVDPADPQHLIASSNDYGSCCDQYYTSFDGGRTWRTGNMSTRGPNVTGSDPITVIDPKHHTAIHISLNFKTSTGGPATNGDVVSSVSRDGGITWQVPTIVGQGRGARLFSDKEDAVVDTDPASPYYGRTYVTWTGFYSDAKRYLSSPIFAAHSDDGGTTWSTPQVISGSSARYCTYSTDGPAGVCDENQFSSPRVGPGGILYVAFENSQHTAAWEPGELFENQYLLVASRDGGRTFSAPRHVLDLEDGDRDYPTNASGRQTLTGLQLRVNSAGALAVDSRTGRLYLTFSDNRTGTRDVANPATDVRAYVVTSGDGATWSAPSAVSSGGEAWFPWPDVAPNGSLGILYNSRRPGNTYVAELAQGAPGAFTRQDVSTARSFPDDSRYFKARVAACPDCALFHGDYLGLDYGSDGRANMVWTDMRDTDPASGTGHLQFVYFARR
jgi:hypothetical protein